MSTLAVLRVGLVPDFWSAIGLLVLWDLMFATVLPLRQAYLNDQIPSQQRATVLSFGLAPGIGRASRETAPAGASRGRKK